MRDFMRHVAAGMLSPKDINFRIYSKCKGTPRYSK